MRNLLNRLFSRSGMRSFDAAGGGRRWEGARTVDGLNTAILAGATTAARRAGWYARNNPWVAAAVDSLVGNVVGAGIKPQSTHPDRAVRERLQMLWLRWTDHADPGGLADFYGLQAMAVRAMVEGGESFARLRVVPDAAAVPLHIDLLDRDQVPLDLHRDIGGGGRIRAGIEFNGAGQRTAYWVMRDRPGDPLTSLRLEPLRLPATDCLHLFKPLAAGQLRGITWLAPVLLRLHELDQFEDAAPGSLIPLPPGTDIRFSNPTESDSYGPFVKNHLRAVAAGMGLPYELVSGDLEGVTYSSIRAGLIEFRRRVEQLQHNVVVHLFCRPVWDRFVRLAVLSGDLPARDFDRDPAAYLGCEWLPPKFDYVDPKKDVEAEILAINAGLKSRRQAISERGYDAEQVDAEIAADKARTDALGLSFEAKTAAKEDNPDE